jgi:hypothetical protein
MKVTYQGRYDAVEVVLPEGGNVVATKGQEVEVPDEVAKNLAEQGDEWSVKGASSSKKEGGK